MKKWVLLAGVLFSLYCCKSDPPKAVNPEDEMHEKLVEQLTKDVRATPDSSPVRMRLVNALDSLGNYKEALLHMDTMIMKDSLNNGLWYAKAQLHESNADTIAAIASYEQALNIYPSLEAQFALANLYAEKGDERALLICQSLSKISMDRETTAHLEFIQGVYYARTGQAAKAISSFDKCINNNYTYMVAYMEKGFVFFDLKKYQEAVQVFDRAITVNNQYADAYYWLAKTYEAMGNKQEALLNYQRSLGLDKELKEARDAINRLNG